ncbi:MAG TPA: hypothetical protein VEV61_13560 [Streptosporangiaceae bacterium]|nr:hypothetical protein [Streptosporangiaceae bacterium]
MSAIALERARSWRALGWVTWRQQRASVGIALCLLAGAALILVLSGVPIHHTAARLGPGWWIQTRRDGYYSWTTGLPLLVQAVPVLAGAFAGAPLLAREAEAGTLRFAWTQGTNRVRLLVIRLIFILVLPTVAAVGVGLLYAWWQHPMASAGVERSATISADLLAPSFAAWVLFGVALGVLAGAAIRQTVAAMGATIVGYMALMYVTALHWRNRYLPPLSGPASRAGQDAVSLNQFQAFPGGRPLTPSQLAQNEHWYATHHVLTWAIYQPASRFWTFQWIEAGWLTVLTLLLVGATIVIIRKRAV